MERCVLDRWDNSEDIEVFYDSFQRKLLMKKIDVLQTLQVDEMITGQAWRIPGFEYWYTV